MMMIIEDVSMMKITFIVEVSMIVSIMVIIVDVLLIIIIVVIMTGLRGSS